MPHRPIHEIATQIARSWKNINYGAKPYLNAMYTLNSIDDMYMQDTAKSVVLYFLANAQTWRGEDAKRIKAELKKMAGVK